MKMSIGWAGLVLAVSMIFLSACESDSAPDEFTFRNQSSRQVAVTLRNTVTGTDYRFTLAANGGMEQYPKVLSEPLTYTYTPTATVSARFDDDVIYFEDR